MGTERQGIHKDMDMKRIDEEGNVIADYEWGEEKLIYEEIKEEGAAEEGAEAPPEKCTVTLFEHPDFTGWEAAFTPGEYDHAALADGGAATCGRLSRRRRQRARRCGLRGGLRRRTCLLRRGRGS